MSQAVARRSLCILRRNSSTPCVGASVALVTAVASMPVESANRGFREHRGLHHRFDQAATKRFVAAFGEAATSHRGLHHLEGPVTLVAQRDQLSIPMNLLR